MAEAIDGLGTVATGTLLATEVERARIAAPAVGHAEHEACANCGTIRQGAYCHACGQAGHVHRNLGALAHDIAHGVFHFEGRIWTTLPLLAWHPGRLTRRYVDGERAKFVSPMALFLFSVFLMFAVVSNLPGHGQAAAEAQAKRGGMAAQVRKARSDLADLEARRARTPAGEARTRLDGKVLDARKDLNVLVDLQRAGVGAEETARKQEYLKLDHDDVHTGFDWLDDMILHAAKNPELLIYKMKNYGYKYSWALIPLSLPFMWLLFAFRRDVGLYDHAIFSIYSLSFMSLGVVVLAVLGAAGLPGGFVAIAAMIIPPVHMYRQLKGAYGLGRFGAGWRTMVLLAITFVTLMLFLSFLFYLGSE